MYPPCRHISMLPRTKEICTIDMPLSKTNMPMHSASTAPAGHNRPPDQSSKPRELAGRQCTMPLRYSAIRITRRGDCLSDWLHLTRRSSCWRRRASSASWTRTGLISFTRHPLPAHPILEAPVQALLAPPHHRRLADMRQRLYFDLDVVACAAGGTELPDAVVIGGGQPVRHGTGSSWAEGRRLRGRLRRLRLRRLRGFRNQSLIRVVIEPVTFQ